MINEEGYCMKLNKILLIGSLVFVFSNQCFALAVDEWEYKTITGNLKATPGCTTKEKATKKASPGSYRFRKYTKLLCTDIAYGWSLEGVENEGELACDVCDDWDDDDAGDTGFTCQMNDVVVKCRTVKKGW